MYIQNWAGSSRSPEGASQDSVPYLAVGEQGLAANIRRRSKHSFHYLIACMQLSEDIFIGGSWHKLGGTPGGLMAPRVACKGKKLTLRVLQIPRHNYLAKGAFRGMTAPWKTHKTCELATAEHRRSPLDGAQSMCSAFRTCSKSCKYCLFRERPCSIGNPS